jgi:hypothetical protein
MYSLQKSLLRSIKVNSLSRKRNVVREEYGRYGCQSGVVAAGVEGRGAGGAVDARQEEGGAGGVWKSDCESGDAGVVSAVWVCGDGARAAGDGEDCGVGKVSGRRRRGSVRCGAGLLVKSLDLCCEVSELYLCLRLSTIVLKSWSHFLRSL